jgi:hypothetical protein
MLRIFGRTTLEIQFIEASLCLVCRRGTETAPKFTN